jgi:hypothetical protein
MTCDIKKLLILKNQKMNKAGDASELFTGVKV